MALDWHPGKRPKRGHKREFERIVQALKDKDRPDLEDLLERYHEISISAYRTLKAPRVGYSERADWWAKQAYADAAPDMTQAAWMAQLKGVYVLALVPPCDGLPRYTVDEDEDGEAFTFRAERLLDCRHIIGDELLNQAYVLMSSKEMLAYGNALLAGAHDFAAREGIEIKPLYAVEPDRPEIKIDIVLSAGRWCIFWAERGHILHSEV